MVKGTSFVVHNKSLSATHEFVTEVTFRTPLSMGDYMPVQPTM